MSDIVEQLCEAGREAERRKDWGARSLCANAAETIIILRAKLSALRGHAGEGAAEVPEPKVGTVPAPPMRTCSKCGQRGHAFVCMERGCPVNGGAAWY